MAKKTPRAASPEAVVPESWFLTSWRPYAWIGLSGFALYARVLSFGYVYLDDNALILENYPFLSRWSSVLEAFKQDVFHVSHGVSAYYRPLFMASLVCDAHWCGLSPGGYHLTNLLIHVEASGLLYLLFTRLGYAKAAALFFSLAFVVSPVLTQAVALIPCRDDSLMGLFALASFVVLIDYLGTRSWKHYLAHIFLFAVALFSKETAVVLIPLFILYLHLIAGECILSPAERALVPGWLGVAAAWFLLRRAALDNPLPMSVSQAARSVAASLPSLVQFCGKILLPFNLSVLPLQGDTTFVYGFLGLALLLAALALTPEKRWRRIAFGAAWFVLFLLPSLTLHFTSFADVMMEKRIYVPLMGFLMILLETRFARSIAGGGRASRFLGAALLLGYAAVAFNYEGDYRDRLHFWRNAAAASPHLPLAHRNLGAMYYLDGSFDRAAAEFQSAAALNPAEPMVHNNLGLILMGAGRLPEAEGEYKKELAINPRYDHALFNLGLLYYREGRIAQAESSWKETLEANPNYASAYSNLIVLAVGRKDFSAASDYVERMRSRGLPIPPEIGRVAASFK